MKKYLEVLEKGVSPFHVVSWCEEELKSAGFRQLAMEEAWDLEEQGKYYVNHHGSTILAFTLPKKEEMLPKADHIALRLAGAHTDWPCPRIKANPDMNTKGYLQVNTEVYGGAILNTWLDRPLGVAGKVALKSEQALSPKVVLFDSESAICTIPNLAIHMNREVNKGVELNAQTQMLPVLGMGDDESAFLGYLAQKLGVDASDILDFELSVYDYEKPEMVGLHKELVSSPRIDNLSSCAALIDGMTHINQVDHVNLAALFDHEEIGSDTKQGAGSALLTDVLEKIYESMGYTLRQAKDAIYQGLMLSVDVAHALHPNYINKEDITNQPIMGKGFVIKEASAQSYATDCEAIAMVEQLAQQKNISYQKFVNRSDVRGGGTLGAITSALLPMRIVDIGVPMLAMHSARELMGAGDYESLKAIVGALYDAD